MRRQFHSHGKSVPGNSSGARKRVCVSENTKEGIGAGTQCVRGITMREKFGDIGRKQSFVGRIRRVDFNQKAMRRC